MKMTNVFFKGGCALLVLLLAACGGGSDSGTAATAPAQTITGTVLAAPADSNQFARNASSDDPLTLLAGWFRQITATPVAQAAVSGLVPVAGASVELVRLDNTGAVVSVVAGPVIADAAGAYTFASTPAPDATLAVRVVGQTSTMRAIVTGSQVDVTPVSEVVTQTVAATSALTNFAPREVAALNSLLAGMDVDLTAKTFAQSVTDLQSASGSILPDLASGMATPGVATSVDNKAFQMIDFSLMLIDPLAAGGVGKGGLVTGYGVGNGFFGALGLVQGSGFTGGSFFRHNLSRLGLQFQDSPPLAGLSHIAAANGRLAVEMATGQAVAGLVKKDGRLLAYPLEEQPQAGQNRQGLRLMLLNAFSPFGQSTVLDNTLLDTSGIGAATTYNYISLEARLSGAVSATGNRFALQARSGSITFDADSTTPALPGSSATFGQIGAGQGTPAVLTLDSSRLELPLGPAIGAPVSPLVFDGVGDASLDGRYTVFQNGAVQLRDGDDRFSFLGSGSATQDGGLLALYLSKSLFETELDVLANDQDAHGDRLTITAVTAPASGAARIASDGRSLFYTPSGADPAVTSDTFSYTLQDAAGLTTTASVTLNLVAVDAAPTAVADSFTVNVGGAQASLDVLANDSDAAGDELCVAAITVPPVAGVAVIAADARSIDYTPPATGVSDSLSYIACDSSDPAALQSAAATVTINLVADQAPLAVADSFTLNAGLTSQVALDVLANDSDAVGDELCIASITAPTNGTLLPINGVVRQLLYTPNPAAASDSWSYTLGNVDGTGSACLASLNTATVTVTLSANAAPVGGADVIAVNVDNRAHRGLSLAALQPATAMSVADLSGVYNVVEYSTDFTPLPLLSPTNALIASNYRYGALTLDGAGGINAGSLFRKRLELDLAAARAAAVSALAQSPTALAPSAPAAGSVYTLSTTGQVDMTLVIGGETIAGKGFATADGDFIALVSEVSEATTGRKGRGLLLLSRQ